MTIAFFFSFNLHCNSKSNLPEGKPPYLVNNTNGIAGSYAVLLHLQRRVEFPLPRQYAFDIYTSAMKFLLLHICFFLQCHFPGLRHYYHDFIMTFLLDNSGGGGSLSHQLKKKINTIERSDGKENERCKAKVRNFGEINRDFIITITTSFQISRLIMFGMTQQTPCIIYQHESLFL